MYKSFVLPHLDYSDVVWDNCNALLAAEMEKLHLDAIRTIIGAVRGTSHQKLYVESGFITLQERRRRHKLILYCKLVNGMVPAYLLGYLPPLISAVNPYHRRKPFDRQISRCRTELYKHSCFPSSSVLWNELPDSVKQTSSVGSFKRFLSRDDPVTPPFYYSNDRTAEIIPLQIKIRDYWFKWRFVQETFDKWHFVQVRFSFRTLQTLFIWLSIIWECQSDHYQDFAWL